MAVEWIAVVGRTITFTPRGSWSPGTPTWIQFEGEANGQGSKVLIDYIEAQMLALDCTGPYPHAGGGTGPGMGGQNITPNGSKVRSKSKFVLRENDIGVCQGAFVQLSPFAMQLCTCDVKITAAGQTKVRSS